jgi:hypothetical protein
MGKRLAVAAAILVLSLAAQAKADQIPVQNSTFSAPGVGYGGYTSQTPGWTSSDAAIYSPIVGVNVNSIPSGFQVAAVGDGHAPGYMFQDLGVPVVAGAKYTINLSIGSRLEGYASHWLVELWAGNEPIGQLSGTVAVGNGNFVPVTLTATGALSGNLGIFVSETGAGQTLFTNVQAFGPSANDVPEPASLTLFGLGAAGLVGYGLRRRLRLA